MRANLKKARQEAGMTQQEVADRRQHIKRRIAILEVVQCLAIALAVAAIVIDLT